MKKAEVIKNNKQLQLEILKDAVKRLERGYNTAQFGPSVNLNKNEDYFICNAVGNIIICNFKSPRFLEPFEYVEEYMPKLFEAIVKHGKELNPNYVSGSAWYIRYSENKSRVKYRINWLNNYIKQLENKQTKSKKKKEANNG